MFAYSARLAQRVRRIPHVVAATADDVVVVVCAVFVRSSRLGAGGAGISAGAAARDDVYPLRHAQNTTEMLECGAVRVRCDAMQITSKCYCRARPHARGINARAALARVCECVYSESTRPKFGRASAKHLSPQKHPAPGTATRTPARRGTYTSTTSQVPVLIVELKLTREFSRRRRRRRRRGAFVLEHRVSTVKSELPQQHQRVAAASTPPTPPPPTQPTHFSPTYV